MSETERNSKHCLSLFPVTRTQSCSLSMSAPFLLVFSLNIRSFTTRLMITQHWDLRDTLVVPTAFVVPRQQHTIRRKVIQWHNQMKTKAFNSQRNRSLMHNHFFFKETKPPYNSLLKLNKETCFLRMSPT